MPAQVSSRHMASPMGDVLLPDFRPVLASERTFGLVDIASLWIGLVVSLTTYFLAGSMVADMGELQTAHRSSCVCCDWVQWYLTWKLCRDVAERPSLPVPCGTCENVRGGCRDDVVHDL